MALIDGLLNELEEEAITTRRVLERVPEAHLSWKPHPKSMSLGELAMHLASIPAWGVLTLREPFFDLSPPFLSVHGCASSRSVTATRAARALAIFSSNTASVCASDCHAGGV